MHARSILTLNIQQGMTLFFFCKNENKHIHVVKPAPFLPHLQFRIYPSKYFMHHAVILNFNFGSVLPESIRKARSYFLLEVGRAQARLEIRLVSHMFSEARLKKSSFLEARASLRHFIFGSNFLQTQNITKLE